MEIFENNSFKKVVAVVISILILYFGAYWGEFLPLQKSQTFINTLRTIGSAKTLQDLEKQLSIPLDLPSPIGQEELVRNSSNLILNLVQQNSSPDLIGAIINYMNSYYAPIISRNRGMSFEQNLYILGAINEMAFTKTKDPKYLQAAQEYYGEGLTLGPKRPQFLYGMFDIYRIEGNLDGAKSIAAQILSQWPNDARTQAAISQFLQQATTTTSGKTTNK